MWLLYFFWSGQARCSLHGFLHVTETSATLEDEQDAQLDARNQPSDFPKFVCTSFIPVLNHGNIVLENVLVDAAAIATTREPTNKFANSSNGCCGVARPTRLGSQFFKHFPFETCPSALQNCQVSKCGPPYDGVIESESSVLSDIVGVVYGAVVTEIGEKMVKLEMAMFAEPSCLDRERLDYAGLADCDSQVTLENITDQRGVFAGLVQHVPEECLTVFPPIYNLVLEMWKFQIVGGQPGPICCRQNSVLCMQVISCQLLTHECCTSFCIFAAWSYRAYT